MEPARPSHIDGPWRSWNDQTFTSRRLDEHGPPQQPMVFNKYLSLLECEHVWTMSRRTDPARADRSAVRRPQEKMQHHRLQLCEREQRLKDFEAEVGGAETLSRPSG